MPSNLELKVLNHLKNMTLEEELFNKIFKRPKAIFQETINKSKLNTCSNSRILSVFDRTMPDVISQLKLGFPEISGQNLLKNLFSQLNPWFFPNSILNLGFDEVRFISPKTTDPDLPEDLTGILDGIIGAIQMNTEDQCTDDGFCRSCIVALKTILENIQVRSPNGVWHGYEYLLGKVYPEQDKELTANQWIELGIDILASKSNLEPKNAFITLPQLYMPENPFSETQAHVTAQGILKELVSFNTSLKDLHWRQLEELVAELLYGLGMDVSVTNRSHDGGRDVIARGEFIPGEPSTIAVEVKHMPIVPISKLREALWANRNFPTLLLATSGRFSAGIFKEKSSLDSNLRLILKDGVALSQWIDLYAARVLNQTK